MLISRSEHRVDFCAFLVSDLQQFRRYLLIRLYLSIAGQCGVYLPSRDIHGRP